MSISTTLKIGDDEVDLSKPCDVVTALEKVEIKLATGAQAVSVEIGGEKVTFSDANASRLKALINKYQERCTSATSGTRGRFAKRVRWV